MKFKLLTFSLAFLLLMVTLLPSIVSEATLTDTEINDELPSLASLANLRAILKEADNFNGMVFTAGGIAFEESATVKTMNSTDSSARSSAPQGDSDYSGTNVQVAGVDEADVIKTDGDYIYQINNNRIVIIQAQPADQLAVIKTIKYDPNQFMPIDLYVDEQKLVVIGSSYSRLEAPSVQKDMVRIAPDYLFQSNVKMITYDITDKNNITTDREVEMEGQYITSRKIGSVVYLVANKYLDVYRILNENVNPSLPTYQDSLAGNQPTTLEYKDIKYFPNSPEANFLLLGVLDINSDNAFNVSAYLGAGQTVYASTENLYVTVTSYDNPDNSGKEASLVRDYYLDRSTEIYKFQLNSDSITFVANGQVPGTVLNQFSMDENNGYFRIATTTGEMWRDDEYTAKNNLYILDEQLSMTGSIEDIAPSERIYSVRFIGDRGYMVTFRNVDPLFVLDLADPKSPKILGKLKIPGYSDYLHPYDENHIIGFGKETIVLDNKNGNGEMAYYQGMKIALFDVTDVSNPKELYVEIIGDRGTDSELLYNHKALLFSKEKNLLAFPVTVMEVKNQNDPLAYGEFSFQGAYVYNLDLTTGFTLKKAISHLTKEDYNKSGYGWYESGKNVERVLYIDDALYSISKGMIKTNKLETLEELDSLLIN